MEQFQGKRLHVVLIYLASYTAAYQRVALPRLPQVSLDRARAVLLPKIHSSFDDELLWNRDETGNFEVTSQQLGWGVGLCVNTDNELEIFLNVSRDEDADWLCVRLLRDDSLGSSDVRAVLNVAELEQRVSNHQRALDAAHDRAPGLSPHAWSRPEILARLLPPSALETLTRTGVVVVDNALDLFLSTNQYEGPRGIDLAGELRRSHDSLELSLSGQASRVQCASMRPANDGTPTGRARRCAPMKSAGSKTSPRYAHPLLSPCAP